MSDIKLYNSLTRNLEIFKPLRKDKVLIYACGPTVYDHLTIGNHRTFTLVDILNRVLSFNGYKTKLVMNFTDVGHLSGDNFGDANSGEDRSEQSAKRQGKSAREISDFYINEFYRDIDCLNHLHASKYTRATDYIDEQIAMVKDLEGKGYTYRIADGIYYDTSKFADYGVLTGMSQETVLEGARVEGNPEKHNPMDFALWKFSPEGEQRLQEWESPWGIGFPGWHLECSAMAKSELGDSIDIHLGGEDLKMHHQNEIAQSEAVTGSHYANYWVHGSFLLVDGGKMGKSKGNAYTIDNILSRNFNPLSLRYFYLTGHYRTQINFTWEALTGAQNALRRLYDLISSYSEHPDAIPDQTYLQSFQNRVNEDLNMPEALAIMWELLKSGVSEPEKIATVLKMDEVLGFKFSDYVGFNIPKRIKELAFIRSEYRKSGIWEKADSARKELAAEGYHVEDLPDGSYKIKPLTI